MKTNMASHNSMFVQYRTGIAACRRPSTMNITRKATKMPQAMPHCTHDHSTRRNVSSRRGRVDGLL